MKRILSALVCFLALVLLLLCAPAYGDSAAASREIFENNSTIMLIIDADTGRIINANLAAEQFYGYTVEELQSMSIDQINVMDHEAVKAERSAALTQERNYFEFQHKLKNGQIRYVEVYSTPYTLNVGNRLLFSIVHDVTAEKIAEDRAAMSWIVIIGCLAVLVGVLVLVLYMNNRSKKELDRINQQMKKLFDNMQEGFALHEIICDDNGKPVDYRFLDANRAFETITGLKPEAIINQTVKTIMPNTESYWIEKYGKVALTGEPITFTNYSKALDKHFYVSVYRPFENRFVTIFTDMTTQKTLENTLRSERALFETTLHSIGDGVISADEEGRVEIMNAVAEELTGWRVMEAKGRNIGEVFIVVDEETMVKLGVLDAVTDGVGDQNTLHRSSILVRKNGETLAIEETVARIRNGQDGDHGTVIVFRDYTDKKEKQEQILYLSYHDQLTGLYNRRFFEEELRRLDTERNLPLTLVMVDVNGLKLTNDAFGHLVGDALLKMVAQVLKEECRSDDIISRIGGDEFVILLPGTTSEETDRIMYRIRRRLSDERLRDIVISISAGWATKETLEESTHDIFIKAEENMYRKKLTESQSMRNRTIQVILKTLNEKSKREKIHSEKVSEISKRIGEAMDMGHEALNEIGIAGLMHDIGKIAVSEAVLNKPGRLTDAEYDEIKRHPESGYQILKSVDHYSFLADYALSHHERWDGGGYPRGLKGEEIPLIARIICVADAFAAMTSERPYRKAMSEEEAFKELQRHKGTQFDPAIVDVCLKNC